MDDEGWPARVPAMRTMRVSVLKLKIWRRLLQGNLSLQENGEGLRSNQGWSQRCVWDPEGLSRRWGRLQILCEDLGWEVAVSFAYDIPQSEMLSKLLFTEQGRELPKATAARWHSQIWDQARWATIVLFSIWWRRAGNVARWVTWPDFSFQKSCICTWLGLNLNEVVEEAVSYCI